MIDFGTRSAKGHQLRRQGFDTKLAAEVAAEQGTRTTTVRWTVRQLRTIERAAARFGMPYQTYVKDAAFRRALQDLVDADRVGA